MVRLYRLRWRIEEVFRASKSDGMRLEETQVHDAGRLFKLAVVGLAAACRTIQLVDARDGSPRPATDVIDPHPAARRRSHRSDSRGQNRTPKEPPSVAFSCVVVLDHCETWRVELLLQTARTQDNESWMGTVRNDGCWVHDGSRSQGLVKCATPVARSPKALRALPRLFWVIAQANGSHSRLYPCSAPPGMRQLPPRAGPSLPPARPALSALPRLFCACAQSSGTRSRVLSPAPRDRPPPLAPAAPSRSHARPASRARCRGCSASAPSRAAPDRASAPPAPRDTPPPPAPAAPSRSHARPALASALPRLFCVIAQSSGTRSRVLSSSAAR